MMIPYPRSAHSWLAQLAFGSAQPARRSNAVCVRGARHSVGRGLTTALPRPAPQCLELPESARDLRDQRFPGPREAYRLRVISIPIGIPHLADISLRF
jgi:hypothetical protein